MGAEEATAPPPLPAAPPPAVAGPPAPPRSKRHLPAWLVRWQRQVRASLWLSRREKFAARRADPFEIGRAEIGFHFARARNRRARGDAIPLAAIKRVVNAFEIVTGIATELPDETELGADRPHKIDIEAGGGTVAHEFEGRIGNGRADTENARRLRSLKDHGARNLNG